MNKSIIALFSLCLFFSNCSDDGDDPLLVLPSNLAIDVENSDDGSGNVSITATAENANFYTIYFGEGDAVKANDGKADHKYTASGTYTISVQAHATADKFIEESTDVTVTIKINTTIPTTGYSTPLTYDGMTLVWQDEFDGSTLNSSDWTFETGGHGWGNNELQYYRPDNTAVQDGYLIITAKKENYMGSEYTSSRIITKDKQSFQYGRIDIRAALPKGQGIWPALWMLGANFSTVGWPASGEIDIMEMIGGGGRENTVHGTVHWDNGGSYASYGDDYVLPSGTFADEFHVFTIIWDENTIKWYVDDNQFNVIDITPAGLSEFRNEFFFIVNIAVGGNWPGSPNASTVFPQHLVVDYIRVFQED